MISLNYYARETQHLYKYVLFRDACVKRAAVVHVVQEDITIVPFVENNFLSIMKSD